MVVSASGMVEVNSIHGIPAFVLGGVEIGSILGMVKVPAPFLGMAEVHGSTLTSVLGRVEIIYSILGIIVSFLGIAEVHDGSALTSVLGTVEIIYSILGMAEIIVSFLGIAEGNALTSLLGTVEILDSTLGMAEIIVSFLGIAEVLGTAKVLTSLVEIEEVLASCCDSVVVGSAFNKLK